MEFIYDRTQTDVDRILSLSRKGWAAMTDEERTYWSGTPKGAYNASDLNRVERNTAELRTTLAKSGYHTEITTKTDWQNGDIPRRSEAENLLGNVRTLAALYYVLPDSPPLPVTMEKLSYHGANAIEKIQADIALLIGRMETGYRKLGTLKLGQGVILPK